MRTDLESVRPRRSTIGKAGPEMSMDVLTDLVLLGRESTDEHVLHKTKLLTMAMPVKVQPIADYIYKGTEQEYWQLGVDFPNLAPVWPITFFQWIHPTESHSNGKILRSPYPDIKLEIGVLGIAADLSHAQKMPEDFIQHRPPTARWFTEYTLFYRDKGAPNFLYVTLGFFVGPGGEFTPTDPVSYELTKKDRFRVSKLSVWPLGELDERNPYRNDPYSAEYLSTMYPAFLAVSFMHCRNVILPREDTPPKVYAKRILNRGWSPKFWHTINIQPMQRVLKEEGRAETVGGRRAILHCRGHFKHFGEQYGTKKLFGKYEGMWFWPSRQIANIDYQVKAPKK